MPTAWAETLKLLLADWGNSMLALSRWTRSSFRPSGGCQKENLKKRQIVTGILGWEMFLFILQIQGFMFKGNEEHFGHKGFNKPARTQDVLVTFPFSSSLGRWRQIDQLPSLLEHRHGDFHTVFVQYTLSRTDSWFGNVWSHFSLENPGKSYIWSWYTSKGRLVGGLF